MPGFEIETYARSMPPHWRELGEKGDFRFQAEFIEASYPGWKHDPTDDLPQTRAVVIGGVLALRESVQLLLDHAAEATAGAGQTPLASFPDFAVFDCASCHHDLRPESWRLEIVSDGTTQLEKPRKLDDNTAIDLAMLQELGKKHGVKYLKAMQCLNIAQPLGQGLWEGVPLREMLKLVGRLDNIRRVYYWGFHNNDPKQLFQSSLSYTQVMEAPPWDLGWTRSICRSNKRRRAATSARSPPTNRAATS